MLTNRAIRVRAGMSLLDLDKYQLDAVNSSGNALVIAGPGSGKTRVIEGKYGKLCGENLSVLVLTHTRAARGVLGGRGVEASTVHSVCYKGLGTFSTFDRLLTYRGDKQFDWVLVDESQDLSRQQYEVIKSLGRNFFFVGDPYQSIFGFGGLYRRTFKLVSFDDIRKDFSPMELPLKYNYRSNQEIVGRLNNIFPRGLESRCNGKIEGTMAILVRTRIEAEGISTLLRKSGGAHTLRTGARRVDKGSDKLLVATAHCCKGTEFDGVVIRPWEIGSPEELRLYYVAMARARYVVEEG